MKYLLQFIILLCINSIFSQEQDYEVNNTSINSRYAEFGVTYFKNNTVLFASSKKNDEDVDFKKNRRKHNRQMFLELYQSTISENGDLITQKKIDNTVKNMFFESDVTFSSDFKTIYFTWNNFYNTQTRKDSAKWKTLHIVKATVNENFVISNITPFPYNSKEYSIKNPFLSKSGKQLFFISNMPDGYGNFDIYVVNIYEDGTYSKPKNLGPTINTKKHESYPFVDENNTLYFSSYGHKGEGSLDIFKSTFINGSYQKVESLPPPINSKYDDFAFVINANTNSGYFTSNREQGKGDVDIYSFKLKETEQLCTQTISGLLLNNSTQKPLNNVRINLYHENTLIETKSILQGSKYKFELECNKKYRVVAQKENFISSEVEIITNDISNTVISKTFLLTPIKCAQLLTTTVVDSETSKVLDNFKVTLLQNGSLIKTITSNNQFNSELKCNENYTMVIEKENYVSSEIKFKTNSENNLENTKSISLTPIKCSQLITVTVVDSETSKVLDNFKVTLLQNGSLIKTITSNNRFNSELKCNENYTMVIEKENYVSSEIKFKTNSKNNLENTKSISLTPIICSQLITVTVVDSETSKVLDNFKVTLLQNDRLIKTTTSNNQFNSELKCNENYTMVIEKENYVSSEIKFKTNSENNLENTKSISLTPIKCSQQITSTIVDSKTAKPLLDATIAIYQNNVLINSVHINNDAVFNFEMECKSDYKFIVSLKGYKDNSIEIKTTKEIGKIYSKKFFLQPKDKFITARGQKMIKTKPINFDLDKSDIRIDAAIELEKIVRFMKLNPSIKIEVKSHTDSRAPDSYNLNLSNERAQSAKNYIVSKGIDSNRVFSKGYGETELINKCSNGVKCTQAEHAMNRRTEFVIINQ